MSAWQLLGYLIVLSLVVLVWIAIILYIIRANRRRAALAALEDVPTDHMSLYFNEFFPMMIRNFDLVSKTRFNDWSDLISTRLDSIDEHISSVTDFTKRFDTRVNKLEGKIEKLEKA